MPFNLLTNDGDIQLSSTMILGKTSGYFDGMVQQDWNPFVAPQFHDRSTEYLWDWGASPGHDTVGTRKLKWTVFITGTTMAQLMTKVQELAFILSPANTEMELAFQIGTDGFTYFGRPRGMDVVRIDTAHFYAWCECRWEALDPRYYSNTTTTVSTTNALSIPYAMAPQATLQTASAPTPWQMIIRPTNGTMVRPVVTHPDLVWNVRYDNGGTAIVNGKELFLDSRKRTAIHRNATTGTAPDLVDHIMDYTNIWFDLPAWQNPLAVSQTTRSLQIYRAGGSATTFDLILTYRKAFI